MNLTTEYLGLKLKNPLLPGASPMVDDLDTVRRLEDAGAPAIIMHSLFEEQFALEEQAELRDVTSHEFSSAEAATYFPRGHDFALGPDSYLQQIAAIRQAVAIPVIASLNGITTGGWTHHAQLIQEAGASAIELNVYYLATRADQSGRDVEALIIDVLRAVRNRVTIPVAVKLSPYFSALPNFAFQLQRAGVDGLILFNRFYQPDLDPEALDVEATLQLSNPYELRLRLRWLAILSALLDVDLSASGGVHSGLDAIKALMAGATTVQMVSTLLKHGPGRFREILEFVGRWMEEHEYTGIEQLRGSLNLRTCPDSTAFERANYLKILQSWNVHGSQR